MGQTKKDYIAKEEHHKTEEHQFQENLATATISELENFMKLVSEMRRHQIEFFKHRNRTTLDWAKADEKRVDAYIEKYNNPGLFA